MGVQSELGALRSGGGADGVAVGVRDGADAAGGGMTAGALRLRDEWGGAGADAG